MPRSATGCALALAAALFFVDYAYAAEEGEGASADNVDADSTKFSDRDQDHVDFAAGGGDASCGEKGNDHVDFAADGTEAQHSEVKGQGHVVFSASPAGAYAVEACIMPGQGGAEVCGTRSSDHADSSSAGKGAATDKGEDHIDFSAAEADPATAGDSKGDGHVDFSSGDEKGQGHVDFSAGATEPAAGGDRGQGHVVFSVAVRPDGSIEVNGQTVAVCDPAEGCRINLSWVPGSGTVVVQVEDAGGVAYAGLHPMAEPPEQIRLEAAEVRSLAVERQ